MTGRSSRDKGATSEREFAALLRKHGFDAERMGRNGRTAEDINHSIPGVWIECKRRETLAIPQWCRQAQADCGSLEPVVAFRQSRQPWRVVVLADEWLKLKRMEYELLRKAKPTSGSQGYREVVWRLIEERDGDQCFHCGQKLVFLAGEIHHVPPRRNQLTALELLCFTCHKEFHHPGYSTSPKRASPERGIGVSPPEE